MAEQVKDIPKNLDEAVQWLKDNVPSEEQADIKDGKLEAIAGHHRVGRWMRNNWGLWHGSELQRFFKERGIKHADDMSGIILESFQRDLRGEDRDLQGQIKHYREYWKDKGVNPDEIGKEN